MTFTCVVRSMKWPGADIELLLNLQYSILLNLVKIFVVFLQQFLVVFVTREKSGVYH